MSEESAQAFGELKGTVETFMKNQESRDAALSTQIEKVLASVVVVDKKAEAAHKRINKFQWLGAGIGATLTALWTFLKFAFNHGDQVVKTVETIDKLHPK